MSDPKLDQLLAASNEANNIVNKLKQNATNADIFEIKDPNADPFVNYILEQLNYIKYACSHVSNPIPVIFFLNQKRMICMACFIANDGQFKRTNDLCDFCGDQIENQYIYEIIVYIGPIVSYGHSCINCKEYPQGLKNENT